MGIWCVESDERPRRDQHFCSSQTISWASVCTVGLLEMVRFCWTLLQQMNQLIPSTVAIIHWKDYCWSSNTLATCVKRQLKGKDTDAGKDWGQEEKRAREGEMVGCHHWLNTNLGKLQEIVEDRGDGCATIHGVAKSWIWLSNSTTTTVSTEH